MDSSDYRHRFIAFESIDSMAYRPQRISRSHSGLY